MSQKTYSAKRKDVKRNWHLVDADGMVLGQLATKVCDLLIGKHKVDYTPSLEMGDRVVVINAEKVVLTGNKEGRKTYYWHTGYMGGIKQATASEIRKKDATKLITNAVNGMLPKNRLRKVRMANLHVYNDDKHPYGAQLSNKSSQKGDK